MHLSIPRCIQGLLTSNDAKPDEARDTCLLWRNYEIWLFFVLPSSNILFRLSYVSDLERQPLEEIFKARIPQTFVVEEKSERRLPPIFIGWHTTWTMWPVTAMWPVSPAPRKLSWVRHERLRKKQRKKLHKASRRSVREVFGWGFIRKRPTFGKVYIGQRSRIVNERLRKRQLSMKNRRVFNLPMRHMPFGCSW